MYLIYVDESGDPGPAGSSPTDYFVLSALVLAEAAWQPVLAGLVALRRDWQRRFSLLISEELHASAFISNPGPLARISRNDRLRMLLDGLDWCAARPDVRHLSVALDKRTAPGPVFRQAWRALLLQLDAALPAGQQGLVFCDNTDGRKLTELMRTLQRGAHGPAEASDTGLPTLFRLVEDPVFRDSRTSYLHQMADLVAYFAKQLFEPNKFMLRKGVHYQFLTLLPNSLIEQTPAAPFGIYMA